MALGPNIHHAQKTPVFPRDMSNPLHKSDHPYNAGDVVWCRFPMPPREAYHNEQSMNKYRNNPEPGGFTHPVYVYARFNDRATGKPMVAVVYGTSQVRTPRPPHLVGFEGKTAERLGFRKDQYFDAAKIAVLPATKEWFPHIEHNGRMTPRLGEGYRDMMGKEIKRALIMQHQDLYRKSPHKDQERTH